MLALAGSSGSRGAFCCTSEAICAILRRVAEVTSCPKETAWNESGFLLFMSLEATGGCQKIYKPLAYGATADVIYWFVRDVVLTV
jgi:hypothetical protein